MQNQVKNEFNKQQLHFVEDYLVKVANKFGALWGHCEFSNRGIQRAGGGQTQYKYWYRDGATTCSNSWTQPTTVGNINYLQIRIGAHPTLSESVSAQILSVSIIRGKSPRFDNLNQLN